MFGDYNVLGFHTTVSYVRLCGLCFSCRFSEQIFPSWPGSAKKCPFSSIGEQQVPCSRNTFSRMCSARSPPCEIGDAQRCVVCVVCVIFAGASCIFRSTVSLIPVRGVPCRGWAFCSLASSTSSWLENDFVIAR